MIQKGNWRENSPKFPQNFAKSWLKNFQFLYNRQLQLTLNKPLKDSLWFVALNFLLQSPKKFLIIQAESGTNLQDRKTTLLEFYYHINEHTGFRVEEITMFPLF